MEDLLKRRIFFKKSCHASLGSKEKEAYESWGVIEDQINEQEIKVAEAKLLLEEEQKALDSYKKQRGGNLKFKTGYAENPNWEEWLVKESIIIKPSSLALGS